MAKVRSIVVALLVCIVLVLLIKDPLAIVTISEDAIFTTTSNDAAFTIGVATSFYQVELNTSHLWLDQSYNTKFYTRYCIYVVAPANTSFIITSWFASANSSAILTVTSPLATNINLSLYSPNFIVASAIGVVSSSYNSTTQILEMVANTSTSTIITISATVTQTAVNIAPENVSLTITDMEGCGNWVFSEEQYYHFQARFWDGDGYGDIDLAQIAFTDGVTWVNASYNTTSTAFSLLSGNDIVNLQGGTVTIVADNLIQIIYEIYFENNILDALNVDLYMWCIDTSGESDWDLIQTDYFNIYNLGGHSSLVSSGNAGRLNGSDVFDLYAYANSMVESNITFRNLQHIKMLPTIMVSNSYYSRGNITVTYFVDYCTDEDEWIRGWQVNLTQEGRIIGTQVYWNWTVEWFNRGVLVKNETIGVYLHDQIIDRWPSTPLILDTCRLWIDLWFNKENASSAVGGRINAYYYPMTDSANSWLRWLTGSNWGINEERTKQTMLFDRLQDSSYETLNTQQIKLVTVGCRIITTESSEGETLYVELRDYDVFDLTFGSDPFTGIVTPVFDETRVPNMPQGGFLGAIFSALSQLGTWIGEALGPQILGFWNLFVGFLDTIAAFLGFPGLFSTLFSMIASFFAWFTSSIIYVISMLTPIFLLLGETLGKFATLVSTVVGQWVSMFQQLFAFLDGTYTAGVNVWEDLGGIWWLTIAAILYPIYLLFLWDQRGIDAVINQLKFIIDVMAMLIHGLITVIQFVIGLIHKIIESIPVVE